MSNSALGAAAVTVGLVAAAAGVLVIALGLARIIPGWLRPARWLVAAMVLAAAAAFAVMERALITRDFTVKYVADNGSSATPAVFNFATLWGALEGSILLWTLVLCGFAAAVALRFRSRGADPTVGWALLVMFAVSAFFFALMAGPAAPFTGFDPPAGYDGPGPNPLLQNHILMAFHPPVLYLGYVGFTVPFAIAIAALATGRLDSDWLAAARRWTLLAWGFLSLGIVLGAWWSYETLGWGGYWAWDPVENASFLPWLTGTAYLHSAVAQERRGLLRVWNLSLVVATFSLTILGTFITRSGVLDSVHSFTESPIGPALAGFFAAVVVVSLGLIAWRGDELRSPRRIDPALSRETAFLANNVAFAVFAFIVLLGTVFPLIVEAVDGRTVSVGNPYFDRMTRPVGLALLFLMAVGPVLGWGRSGAETLSRRLLAPAWIGAGAIVAAVAVGARGWAPLLAFGLGGLAAGSALGRLVPAVRRHKWRGLVGRTNGGMVVHLGVVMVAVAFVASQSYVRQGEFDLVPGQAAEMAGHRIAFVGSEIVEHPNRFERVAQVRIDGSGPYGPALASYPFASRTIGIPSVRSTLYDDVALSVLSFPEGASDRVILRVTVQPLVVWLWIGGIVVAAGTALALVPTRPRRRSERHGEPEPEPAVVAASPVP